MFFAILQKNVKLENHQFYIQITYFSGMAHFATTALIRKRVVEKRSEKHIAKTMKIHEKSNENSRCFLHPFLTKFFTDFDLIFRAFSGKKGGKTTPGGVSGISCFSALIFSWFLWILHPQGEPWGSPRGLKINPKSTRNLKIWASRAVLGEFPGFWRFLMDF